MLARVTLDTETGRDRYFAARERELVALVSLEGDALVVWAGEVARRQELEARLCERELGSKFHCLATRG